MVQEAGQPVRPGQRLVVAVGADHGGFERKGEVLSWLRELGHQPVDLGTRDSNAVDYPDFALEVARAVAEGRVDLGVCVDGAGIGSAIAANKVPGVRAANCHDERGARNAREHNFANVLSLGGGTIDAATSERVLRAFLATPEGGARHERRVAKIGGIERRYAGHAPPRIDITREGAARLEEPLGAWGSRSSCLELRADDLRGVLDAGACRLGCRPADPRALAGLARKIDHTLLKPDATPADIDQLCADALEHGFMSVCVNGVWVRRCAEIVAGSGVLVCAVAGFPLGAMAPEVKLYEARRELEDGACEVDMVVNVGALKAGDDEFVRRDIAGLAELCHRNGAALKVILETCLLSDPEKVRGCELAMRAGADFVKTSTGFSTGGATVEDVALMRRTVGPTMGVKASGGVRDAERARAMLAAGATRIGASASIEIAREGSSR